jgi:hypothetical protein
MPPLTMLCVHCSQVLDFKRRGGFSLPPSAMDGDEVCRFCQKNFKSRCLECDSGLRHKVVLRR